MSTQKKIPTSSQHHFHTSPSPTMHTRAHCSTTTTTKPLFATSPPSLVKAATTKPKPIDPSLLSTRSHRTWMAFGCIAVLISLAKFIVGATNLHIWLKPTMAALAGYVLADLVTGVYHWVIDNYGSATTPFFGTQIQGFQNHHKLPSTITRSQFANNLHALARVVTFVVLPIDILCDNPSIHGFVSVCFGCIMFSQQFHAWAHSTKSQLPLPVVALQDLGIIVSRSQHIAHHRPPYNNNYCIVSGIWNKFLDNQKIFVAMEKFLFSKLGVRPRSWSKLSSGLTEDTETPSQITTN